MLFYSDYSSPRLNYILDLINGELFNESFMLISDKEAFKSHIWTKTELLSMPDYQKTNFSLSSMGCFVKQALANSKSTGRIFPVNPLFFKLQGISLSIFLQRLFSLLAGMRNIFPFNRTNMVVFHIRLPWLLKKIFLIFH